MRVNSINSFSLKYFIIFNMLIMFFCAQAGFAQEPEVRVRILKTSEPVKIKFNGEWLLSDGDSKSTIDDLSLLEFKIENNLIFITCNGQTSPANIDIIKLSPNKNDNTVDIMDIPFGVGWSWEGKEDRNYNGVMSLRRSDDNNLEVIITLPVEEYLKGVVPYEIGADSPLEALKVQAVAARSEAFAALASGLYGGEFHDLTSDVECQVFSGNRQRTVNSDKAVEETRGIVLTENGEIINAYYSSTCGGHSEIIKNVWPDRPEKESYKVSGSDWSSDDGIDLSDEKNIRGWILSNPESYCNPSAGSEFSSLSQNKFRWELNLAVHKISRMLDSNKYGMLREIVPLKRGTSGRILKAEFVFENGNYTVEGELNIRKLFSPILKSSCFIVDKDETGFFIKGAGNGHGVGMCQVGALVMASENKSFDEILKHYYKKAELTVEYK